MLAGAALSGCGGGGGGAPADAANNTGSGVLNPPVDSGFTIAPTAPEGSAEPPAPANQAPSLGGAPTESVLAGDTFVFEPVVADPDGDQLELRATNLPRWATFDPATGTLKGTPKAADVGRYARIEISVSDGKQRTVLVFDLEVVAIGAGSFTLSWTPATRREDGSPLENLAGHKIYWGTKKGDYPHFVLIDNAGITTYMIEGLVPDTYYVAMSSVDSDGIESVLTKPVKVKVRTESETT